MTYFVTGGTGFIGRHVVVALASLGRPVHVLTRSGSKARLDRLLAQCGRDREHVLPVEGEVRC